MRYCAIAYTYYDRDNRVRRYCESLADQGHEVNVIALKSPESKEKEIVNGVMVHRIQKRTFESHNLIRYLWNYIRFFIKGMVVLNLLNIRRRFALLHFHNIPDFLVFMGVFQKMLGAKIILDIHDIVPEFFCQKFKSRMESIPIRLLILVERMSIGFSDHVITANDIWRERIISRDRVPPGKCTSILNYPSMKIYGDNNQDRSPLKAQGDEGVFRLVYPGTISQHHGIDVLIKAVGIARNSIPRISLDIYCLQQRSKQVENLREMVRNLELEGLVSFREALTPEELAKNLESYDAGVVPKRGGIFAGEAFSSKIFDFMASGLPIVSSRTPIDEYYFNDDLISFFEVEDSQDLAEKIVDLYRNPSRGKQMAVRAREYVSRNNWEIKKADFLDIVRKLCGGQV